MPIHLPPLSRRQFLAGSLASAAGLLARRDLLADQPPTGENRFALLADTHIAGNRAEVNRGANMFDNLEQVARQLVELEMRPARVMVTGDCAYLTGQDDDYANLVQLLEPMRAIGMPVDLALGNHDNRQRFWQAIPRNPDAPTPVEQRQVSVVRSEMANWFLLDSLDQTNHTPGILGHPQLAWLAEALDGSPDKPALVLVHHNPDERPGTSGLVDTEQLMEILLKRRQVKALIFGHTHNWSVQQREGIHLVNLPPVAYVFTPGKPNGWVDARLRPEGATVQLRTMDPDHAQNGQRVDLVWRA